MESINQGISQHNYFTIAKPAESLRGRVSIEEDFEKPVYELKHPRTNEIVHAQLIDIWQFDLSFVPSGMCYLAYGMPAKEIIPLLMKKYPQLKSSGKIEFLLLKKL